jgi:hypothetical protein
VTTVQNRLLSHYNRCRSTSLSQMDSAAPSPPAFSPLLHADAIFPVLFIVRLSFRACVPRAPCSVLSFLPFVLDGLELGLSVIYCCFQLRCRVYKYQQIAASTNDPASATKNEKSREPLKIFLQILQDRIGLVGAQGTMSKL